MMASDPVGVVANALLDDEVAQGYLLPGHRSSHVQRAWGEAQASLEALRATGWRIVQTFPGKFGARNLVEIRDEWLPTQPDKEGGEMDDRFFGHAGDVDA